jgi:hypothetical protein
MVAKRAVPPRIGDVESVLQAPHNTLLLNRGDGTFAEIACLAGVEASDWSWSPVFLDVDLDGFEDLLITSGHIRDIQDLDANDRIRAQQESWRNSPMAATNLQRAFVEAKREHARLYPPLLMPVVAFRNRGDLRFEEVTTNWGLGALSVNHGMALADLDNDGDLDVIVNRLGSPAALFRNDGSAPRVAVRLHGKPPNTQAIGAKIELLGGPVSNQVHEVTCGGHYMSGADTLRVFASGLAQTGLSLRVTWRDGSLTDVPNVRPNHLYEIDETAVAHAPRPAPRVTNSPAMFEDVSALLHHEHHDDPFDDFARQPLLPRKLSQGGPGVAWFDLDGDGWDDLIVGSGKGGSMAVFHNQQGKSFARDTNTVYALAVTRDQTTVLGWRRAPGEAVILAGSASYEDHDAGQPAAQAYFVGKSKVEDLPPHSASIGPLALGAAQGDGALELFGGGQVIPGRYPVPAGSVLWQATNGPWTADAVNARALARTGLVNGAVWSDLDGDGWPELILACEWGPVRVFHNEHGQLAEATDAMGLTRFTGLWQSVTTGDFDGDGSMDIVAGNWGWNSCWRATADQPLTLFFGDLAGRDNIDILEAEYDAPTGQWVPRALRDTVAAAVPWLAERFPTHTSWSRATIPMVIGDHKDKMQKATATTLATTVFLNRRGRFEAIPLPIEAQFAPTFGICVADFDGDGREDLFLAQNFFAFAVEDSRLDASRGLLLRGDGRGGFTPVAGPASGLEVYGEQRGAAVTDFDHDGRTDLLVTQNGAATRLFRNTSARPGLRVRLSGPPGNPDGIGAVVRLKFSAGWGPAREVHGGGGYWSQDSASPVLATPEQPSAILVVWPGGRRTEQSLTQIMNEVTIAY